MNYAKLHGCCNAYIYMETRAVAGDPGVLAREVSAPPPRGIGADGLILYGPSDKADVRMIVFNADGSRAAMCGNGVRALGKWILDNDTTIGQTLATGATFAELADLLTPLQGAFERMLARCALPDGPLTARRINVETDSGIKTITALLIGGAVQVASVYAGTATLLLGELGSARPLTPLPKLLNESIRAGGSTYNITCVAVGNLHGVVFVPDASAIALDAVGPALECHTMFPDRANIHFVTVRGRDSLHMRPWERGSGATPACGTGACAALAAAVALGFADGDAEVVQPGGSVCVRLVPQGAERWNAHLIGPAELVETGVWPRPR